MTTRTKGSLLGRPATKDLPRGEPTTILPTSPVTRPLTPILVERNGSTDAVYGLAGERPAGRKLAQDIATFATSCMLTATTCSPSSPSSAAGPSKRTWNPPRACTAHLQQAS